MHSNSWALCSLQASVGRMRWSSVPQRIHARPSSWEPFRSAARSMDLPGRVPADARVLGHAATLMVIAWGCSRSSAPALRRRASLDVDLDGFPGPGDRVLDAVPLRQDARLFPLDDRILDWLEQEPPQ